MKKLGVHKDGRYLQWSDGEPFFYMADTAWELLHRVPLKDIPSYLDTRKEQGFSVIQMVALAELGGMTVVNPQGHLPTHIGYWEDLDKIISMTEDRGMVSALLPTWGDKWNRRDGGESVLNPGNAYQYGVWLGNRYRNVSGLIWVLGGDRPVETKFQEQILDAMATGLREGDYGNHLITFHPCGAASSVDFLRNKIYIDFHSIQSGHGLECYECVELLKHTWQAEQKPFLDMESRYEDFPACFREELGYCWSDTDVRNNLYWNMMCGGLGSVYGHRDVWCFSEGGHVFGDRDWWHGWEHWKKALHRPGAEQIRHLVKLRMMRPFFELRSAEELLDQNYSNIFGRGTDRIAAARGNRYAYIYTPLGLPVCVVLESMGAHLLKVSWYNPRNGELATEGIVNEYTKVFCPPSAGKGQDWVLVLDAV